MKSTLKPVTDWLFAGDRTYRSIIKIFFTGVFLKFFYFNIIWAAATTFISFITFEMWLFTLMAALILTAPYVFTRSVWVGVVVMAALDMWLISICFISVHTIP